MESLGQDIINQTDVLIRKAVWTQKDPRNVRTQGTACEERGRSWSSVSQEDRPQKKPLRHLDLGLPASRIARKYIAVV